MEPLLSIENLSVNFSGELLINALKQVSFKVNRGETVAVVGESGSGKSVTALSILQLVPAAVYSNGCIILHDTDKTTDLLSAPTDTIRNIRGNRVAMVFQEPMTSLNPLMRCGKQVSEAIRLHQKKDRKAAREETLSLFAKVKLPEPEQVYNKYPHQLSGGQKQRVMIAMAMSCRPDLLICDEATTALDVTVQKTILELIKELQQQNNMGVIFITHDLGLVAEIADRVVVMYKGEVVENNYTRDVFLQPQHPYTKALLSCRPVLYKKHERLPMVEEFMEMKSEKWKMKKVMNEPQPTNDKLKATPETLIKAENLNVWFPSSKNFFGNVTSYNKAVNEVNFEVFNNETLGLVGESGCGKTTLGRCLLRLIEPTSGRIFFHGNDLLSYSSGQLRKFRKEVQIVFQDPYSSLNPRLSIGNAIAEPMKVHGLTGSEKESKDRVVALLEKVSLKADHFSRYPHEFSGGQRQRIVIARALALEPSFIVFDESVSALDVSVQAQILNLINDLKSEMGFTAVFISHDLSVVHYISDRIIVMNKGRIEETGTASDIWNNPRNEYTRSLMQAIPRGIIS